MVTTGTNRIKAEFVVVPATKALDSTAVEIDDLVSMFEATEEGRTEMSAARRWVGENSTDRRSLKSLRLAAGLSQTALADAINMSQPNVSAFEAGTRIPSRGTVKKLAHALKLTTTEIYNVLEGHEASAHV